MTLATGPASYTDEGSGPAVVAVHGLPGSSRDFRWLAPHITRSCRFVRVDLPGFGDTPERTEPDPSPTGRARFVLALVHALGVEGPLLLGHSMGGIVACAAADLEPDTFRGLALLSTPGLRPPAMFRRAPFNSLSRLLSRPRLGPAMAPLVRGIFAFIGFRNYSDGELYRTLHCLARTSIPEHAARVRRLTPPTLVAWCEDDTMIESETIAELATHCPDGPRLCFARGGHNPQKSHAAEIGEALTAWFRELD